MIYARSKFRIVKRGFEKTIVLVPGWATDYQIFDTLDLRYNYVLPIDINFIDFKDALLEFLKTSSIERVSFFGWSQGGFLAADFASRNIEMIDELILVGVRKRYDKSALKEIGRKLRENKRVFLHKFYLNCFSRDDNTGRSWFKKRLLEKYLAGISLEDLVRGLDYLSSSEIKAEDLSGVKTIRIFHGREDRIAPLEEALEINASLKHAQLTILNKSGHLLFLSPDFMEKFNE